MGAAANPTRAKVKMPRGDDYSSEAQRIRVMQRWAARPPLTLPPPPFVRVATRKPLSPMQEIVCILLGVGLDFPEIAEALRTTSEAARFHAKQAARKIPGDLNTAERCRAWARGATMDVLDGRSLREFVQRTAVAVSSDPET
jgi:DNA-binding NarL/FixJ family response regulator